MAHRSVHYEAAFEDFVRSRGLPYVAVDEAKKAIFADATLKSFDFLVYSATGPNLLVDVKGRKFPAPAQQRSPRGPRPWENWITQKDAEGLVEWEKVFGGDFRAVLVFAYWLQGSPMGGPFDDLHLFRRRQYAFMAIPLDEYVRGARVRSRSWATLAMPPKRFSSTARPVEAFL